eukprot:Lithocolla_globosa_v1_NODE_1187_length_2800_cov_7.195993.p3 type:complete len:161 gc:universal NODE_1187_length_2800_cov_7.195993:2310-2792(+)
MVILGLVRKLLKLFVGHLTVNALAGITRMHYFNAVEGAGNGTECLQFFHEAGETIDKFTEDSVLQNAIIIMDNVKFHHGQLFQQQLLNLFEEFDARLAYNAKYAPDMSMVEYCFLHMKSLLKIDPEYSYYHTKPAVYEALGQITPAHCYKYGQYMGYLGL